MTTFRRMGSREMDQASQEAREALLKLEEDNDAAIDLVRGWWKEWYIKAGHKRLGRVLLGRDVRCKGCGLPVAACVCEKVED